MIRSNPPKPFIASTDVTDENSIFEIAGELRIRKIGQSFQRTIYSKKFLEDLKTQITPKLKHLNLNKWIHRKIEDIALSEHANSYQRYKKDLATMFSSVQKEIVKEIEKNAKLAFIKAEYNIRRNLTSDIEEWLKGVLQNQHFSL